MAQWDKLKSSRGNVSDRRGMAPVVGGLGLTGVAIYAAVSLLFGADPTQVVFDSWSMLSENQVSVQQQAQTSEFDGLDSYEQFASIVLGSNNDFWRQQFKKQGREYSEPTLVLFRQATTSNCGTATSQIGPHYCPLDQTIYLDETFFDALQSRFGAQGGDVAEAYVIGHEVGHHVQSLLGTLQQAQSQQGNNEAAIALELQADCFAGMWAGSLKDENILAPGEIQEAMDAAAAVGDDRIQEAVQGRVNPESWTHGSSTQRVEWFTKGYEADTISNCQ